MKVISKGKKTIECKRCGCVMEYNFWDIRHKLVRLSELWKVEYIQCPQCGKEIVIERECVR